MNALGNFIWIDLFLNGGKLTYLVKKVRKQVSGKRQLESGVTQLLEHKK